MVRLGLIPGKGYLPQVIGGLKIGDLRSESTGDTGSYYICKLQPNKTDKTKKNK